jgi:hypothetical protein
VVYVDNDPVVLAHARVLLLGTPEGSTTYIDGDLYDIDGVLAEARKTLDFDRPIALILLGILGHVADPDEARLRRLLDPMASGSYLVVADSTNVIDGEVLDAAAKIWDDSASLPIYLRKPEEIAAVRRAGAARARCGVVPALAPSAERGRHGARRGRVRHPRPQAVNRRTFSR